MNITLSRMLGLAIAFPLIFLFGFWLSRSGKPYNTLLFNLHKLIAVGTLIFLAFTTYRLNQAASLGSLALILALLTGLVFLATMITGGLLDLDWPMSALISQFHHVAPYLTLLFIALTLYLLFGRAANV